MGMFTNYMFKRKDCDIMEYGSLLFTAELMDFQKHPKKCLRHRSTQYIYILVDNQGSQIPYQHIPKLAIHFWLQFNTSSLFLSRFDPLFFWLSRPTFGQRPVVESTSPAEAKALSLLILIFVFIFTLEMAHPDRLENFDTARPFGRFEWEKVEKCSSIFWDLNFPNMFPSFFGI